jgi:protoporphyrinogen oxidase
MPTTNQKFSWTDYELIKDAFGCLAELNPDLLPNDLTGACVARLHDGQRICDQEFAAKLPHLQTGIKGLQIASTCFYHRNDRGIAESVRLGRDGARAISS